MDNWKRYWSTIVDVDEVRRVWGIGTQIEVQLEFNKQILKILKMLIAGKGMGPYVMQAMAELDKERSQARANYVSMLTNGQAEVEIQNYVVGRLQGWINETEGGNNWDDVQAELVAAMEPLQGDYMDEIMEAGVNDD